jgi:hypothetical protein
MRPRLAVLLILAAALGAAAGLLLAGTTPAGAAPADVTPIVLQRIDAVPAHQPADVDPALMVAAFGPGAGYDDAAAAEVRLTADRVCEGIAAGVTADEMIAALMRTTGMLPDQSRAFLTAATAGC